MRRTNREIAKASGITLTRGRRRGTLLLTLSASLGVPFFLSACGGSSGGSSGGGLGGSSGQAGSGSIADGELDSDAVLAAATQAATSSEDELSAALAAADLDGQMALARTSGLVTALSDEASTAARASLRSSDFMVFPLVK